MISRYLDHEFTSTNECIRQEVLTCPEDLSLDELQSKITDVALPYYSSLINRRLSRYAKKVTKLSNNSLGKLLPSRWWGILEVIFVKQRWLTFQRHERLGSGGYGVVYRCSIGGNPYAVKCLHKADEGNAKLDQINRIENILATLLQHENLLPGFGSFRYGDIKCRVYLLADRSLSDEIKRKVLSEPTIFLFLKQLVAALRYMHSRSIWHLDVKASNCLIRQGNLFLGDFGAIAGHLYDPSSFYSSRVYASPRLLAKLPINESCDVWGVFIVFLRLVDAPPPLACDSPDLKPLFQLFVQWEGRQCEPFLSYKELVLTKLEMFDPRLYTLMESFFYPESKRPSLREMSRLLKGKPLPDKTLEVQPGLIRQLCWMQV